MDNNRGKSPQKGDKLRAKKEEIADVWNAFNLCFKDEESCWQHLTIKLTVSGQIKCPRCPNSPLVNTKNFRVQKCLGCKKRVWIFADTSYTKKRKLRPRYAAIWLIEHHIEISENCFSEIADISQNFGSAIQKEIQIALEGPVMEDSFFIGSRHFDNHYIRRSVKTPRDKPPVSEEIAQQQEENQTYLESTNGQNQNKFEKPVLSVQFPALSKIEQDIFDYIKAGGTVQVNSIASALSLSSAEALIAISMLEVLDLVEMVPGGNIRLQKSIDIAPGNANIAPGHLGKWTSDFAGARKKNRARSQERCWDMSCKRCRSSRKSKRMENLSEKFSEYVKGTHQGFSRKYLQLFVVTHTFMMRKRHKDQVQIGKVLQENEMQPDTTQSKHFSILDCCLSFGPIKRQDIMNYVSPLLIRQKLKW